MIAIGCGVHPEQTLPAGQGWEGRLISYPLPLIVPARARLTARALSPDRTLSGLLADDAIINERCRNPAAHLHPMLPLTAGGGDEAWLHELHVQEPTKQQVVVQFLAKGPLAAHRVQRDQQRSFEQPLRRNRRSASLGIHLVEPRRQLRQYLVSQSLDRAQRVIVRNALCQIDKRQHERLGLVSSAHPSLRAQSWHVVPRRGRSPVGNKRSITRSIISAAC